MESSIFFIIAFIIMAIIVLSYFFSKKAIVRRKLKKAPFKSLAQFKSGDIAKIVGKVEFAEKPLIAPLSGRECAYYHVKVKERVQRGKSSHWKTIIEDDNTINYLIRDGEHLALIEDFHIKSYIVQDRNYSSGFLNDATPHLEGFLNSWNYESETFLGMNRTLEYKEGVLENQEEIAVLGQGVWKDAEEFNLPAGLGKILAISGVEQGYVYLSDDRDTLNKNVEITQKNRREREKSYERRDRMERRQRYNRRDVNYNK
uniref:hypothetical protein n=1 Tax=uncultured Draconibacterium sp. TaxID=1573823 RepID=UPI0032162125